MKIFQKSRQTIAKGLKVSVSNHYCPTLFGIRGHYETSYKSGQYVEGWAPGTGFFIRTSSSHSYKKFCEAEKAKLKHDYWDFLKGKEFSFDKELARANAALRNTDNETKGRILEAYANVLPMAKEAEEGERIIAGIKELSHKRHKLTSYQSHVMSSYKSRIARLGHDVREIQLSIPQLCTDERYQQFADVVINFTQMAASHRIWHSKDTYGKLENAFDQVYFDLGIFDFIQAPLLTPVMRDGFGQHYYLYPDFVVCARDSVDFDVYDLKSLTFLFREVPYDMIANMVLSSYANIDEPTSTSHHHSRDYEQFGNGLLVNKETAASSEMEKEDRLRERVVGEMYIPEMKLRFYVREVRTLKHFVNAMNNYKEAVYN